MDVPNDGEIEEGEAVPVLIQDGMIKEDGEAEEKEEEDGEEIAEIPQEDVPRVPPPPIDATPLDLGEDAWDDKSLIRAWDESMRLYKQMHGDKDWKTSPAVEQSHPGDHMEEGEVEGEADTTHGEKVSQEKGARGLKRALHDAISGSFTSFERYEDAPAEARSAPKRAKTARSVSSSSSSPAVTLSANESGGQGSSNQNWNQQTNLHPGSIPMPSIGAPPPPESSDPVLLGLLQAYYNAGYYAGLHDAAKKQ